VTRVIPAQEQALEYLAVTKQAGAYEGTLEGKIVACRRSTAAAAVVAGGDAPVG
jgi:hypothetical protein